MKLSFVLPLASCFLSLTTFLVHIIVIQHVLHRYVAGDVVADGEEEAGVLFADGYAALHLGADVGFGAGEQDACVGLTL